MENLVKNKCVLITGDWGFIGSALTLRLAQLGAKVVGYDLLEHQDVRDYKQLQEYIHYNEVEIVYHLAAQSQVPIANAAPYFTFETNILGTLNVLEICARQGLTLVLASSDKAYGEGEHYDLDTPLRGKNPYDVSKLCVDKLAQCYQEREADVITVRLCNVYGPGDVHDHRLIPHLISSYLQGKTPVLRGNPEMVREWLYIEDAVNLYIAALNQPHPVILGSGERASVGKVVDLIRAKMGGPEPVILNNARDEIFRQGFAQPFQGTPLEEGLERTIAWWKGELDDSGCAGDTPTTVCG